MKYSPGISRDSIPRQITTASGGWIGSEQVGVIRAVLKEIPRNLLEGDTLMSAIHSTLILIGQVVIAKKL